MKTILWTVSLLLVICGCTPKPTEVVSPDGHIRLQFALDDHNRMTYRIDVDDTAFVAPSAFEIPSTSRSSSTETERLCSTIQKS